MSLNRNSLLSMRDYNGLLQERILHRTLMIQYEIDYLLSLRYSLLSMRTPTRKRKWQDEPAPAPSAFLRVDAPATRHRWNADLIKVLDGEAAKADCGESLVSWEKERWSRVAEAFRGAGHPPFTSYELFAKYREMHRDPVPLSLNEAHFVCRFVHENGRDWKELCRRLRQRFGHTRSPFQVAQQYRQSLRRAFVENSLTPSQLLTLLTHLPASPHSRDFAAISIEAQRFTQHKTLQVSPLYLKRELESLDFAARVPACHQLYWKLVNLLCNFTFAHLNRLDAFQHKMPFCYQQLSLDDLSCSLQCDAVELRKRVVETLLRSSRPPEALNYEECSRKLFGAVYGARLIYQISETLHRKES
ncbi:hypothetical protein JKF63_02010 [Porcisia hertigi]|uniref:Uncharacterized protein n=1 Tax=Porcisia hertigi TaxID=2761500 RepID=A0A836I0G2_9TRYP|nr:hypothetical protein JKF63_02010 [Porcisia hertigi]